MRRFTRFETRKDHEKLFANNEGFKKSKSK